MSPIPAYAFNLLKVLPGWWNGIHGGLKILCFTACEFDSRPGHHNQTLSKNVKRLREAKGLSQEKLARLADVANNTLIKMETGENKNPTLETLKRVAKALEVSVDELIN